MSKFKTIILSSDNRLSVGYNPQVTFYAAPTSIEIHSLHFSFHNISTLFKINKTWQNECDLNHPLAKAWQCSHDQITSSAIKDLMII